MIGLIELLILVVVIGGIGTYLTTRQSRAHDDTHRHHRSGQPAFGILLAVVAVVMAVALLSYSTVRVEKVQTATIEASRQHLQSYDVEQSGISIPEGETADGTNTASTAGPDWIHQPVVVQAEGTVPDVLLVEQSGLFATPEEAITDATSKAISTLHQRLTDDDPDMGFWRIPVPVFEEHSLQQAPYIEETTLKVGVHVEPMYRAYLQFRDSAHVREPLIEIWQNTLTDQTALQVGIGFASVILGLAFISSLLRTFIAAPGQRVGPAITAGILGLIGLAVFGG